MKSTLAVPLSLAGSVAALFFFQVDFVSSQLSFGGGGTQFRASDPGVRGGAAGAGGQLEGLSGTQAAFFTAGAAEFAEEDNVPDGLGPRMNLDGTADGGVHALFTITGRAGANGCMLAQPEFATQLANRNVIFRIPTPTFGAG